MSEEDKEKDSDRVKPLEVKPGGKKKGNKMVFWDLKNRKR
jgi:hypothetical protein